MRRFWLSFWFAALVGMIAHAAGVPWWSEWKPGDSSDFMLAAFWLAWFASAGEAGTAKTTEIGLAEGEHAVAKPDARKGVSMILEKEWAA